MLLKTIADISAGQGAPQGDANYCDDGTPFVKAGNLNDLISGLSISNIQRVSEEVAKNHKLKLFKKGTILFAKSGMSCLKGYVYVLPCDAYVVSHLACITPHKNISEYIKYYFIYNKPNNLIKDTSYPSISLADIGNIDIDFKNNEDIKTIVSILDKLQSIITHLRTQLEKLDLLVKARFVEMFGEPLLGTQKWEFQCVGDVADAIDPQPSHRTPPIDENGIPYISIKDCNYKTGTIDFDNARKVGKNVLEEHLNRYEIHDGDFIIGKIGTIGNPIFIPARKDYTLSANIVLVQPNTKIVSPYFLKYSFMSDYVERQFSKAKNSTSQAAFGIQKVRSISIMNPDYDVQMEFENFVKQVDKSKATVQKALDEAQLLFDSLMQEYFG